MRICFALVPKLFSRETNTYVGIFVFPAILIFDSNQVITVLTLGFFFFLSFFVKPVFKFF